MCAFRPAGGADSEDNEMFAVIGRKGACSVVKDKII